MKFKVRHYLLTLLMGACTVEWAPLPHPATSAGKPMHPPWREPKPTRGQLRPPGSTPPSALATFLAVSPCPASNPKGFHRKGSCGQGHLGETWLCGQTSTSDARESAVRCFSSKSPRAAGRLTRSHTTGTRGFFEGCSSRRSQVAVLSHQSVSRPRIHRARPGAPTS